MAPTPPPGRGHIGRSVPAGNLLLGDRIVADTRNARLGAAGTARQPLIAAVLAQATAVAGAHVAEVAALSGLGGGRRGRGGGGGGHVGRLVGGARLVVMGARLVDG